VRKGRERGRKKDWISGLFVEVGAEMVWCTVEAFSDRCDNLLNWSDCFTIDTKDGHCVSSLGMASKALGGP